MVAFLKIVQRVVAAREHEAGQNRPFGDCGAVDPRRGGYGDVGRGVERVGLDVVAAGGEEVEPGEVGGIFLGVRRQGGEGAEDGYGVEEGGGWGLAGFVFVVGEVDVRVAGAEVGEELFWFREGAGDEDVFLGRSASHCCGCVSRY